MAEGYCSSNLKERTLALCSIVLDFDKPECHVGGLNKMLLQRSTADVIFRCGQQTRALKLYETIEDKYIATCHTRSSFGLKFLCTYALHSLQAGYPNRTTTQWRDLLEGVRSIDGEEKPEAKQFCLATIARILWRMTLYTEALPVGIEAFELSKTIWEETHRENLNAMDLLVHIH